MTALNQQRASMPATWTAERVRERLVEAFHVERRMPAERFAAVASSWPMTPLHSFADVLHWDDARQRVWDDWAKPRGAAPFEVSRMDEALDWLRLIPVNERKCLGAWAAARARRKSVRKVMRQYGWTPTQFYRMRDKGAKRIADRLNEQGVTVR